jgi:hypothetical protein
VVARNAVKKRGQNRGNICIFAGKRKEIERRAYGEGSRPVVPDVAPTQQSASSHVGADVPAGRQMAPESHILYTYPAERLCVITQGRSQVR